MDWLMKMLMQGQGGQGGAPFGALGGSSGPAANNGMPMSGVGPGMGVNPVGLWAPPGSNVNPGGGVTPGGAPAGSPMNDASPLAGFGSNPQGGGGPTAAQKFGIGQIQSLLQPQQIQTPGWMPWMPMR